MDVVASRLASGERRIVDFGVFFDFVERNDNAESCQSEGWESDDDIPLAVVKKRLKRGGDEKGWRICPSNGYFLNIFIDMSQLHCT